MTAILSGLVSLTAPSLAAIETQQISLNHNADTGLNNLGLGLADASHHWGQLTDITQPTEPIVSAHRYFEDTGLSQTLSDSSLIDTAEIDTGLEVITSAHELVSETVLWSSVKEIANNALTGISFGGSLLILGMIARSQIRKAMMNNVSYLGRKNKVNELKNLVNKNAFWATQFEKNDIKKALKAEAKAQEALEMLLALGCKDFSHMWLCGLDFSHRDLRGFKFDGATISGTNFYHANLSDASFVRACGYKAIISNVVAERTNFENAEIFDSDLSHSIFSGSSFKKARIVRCSLSDSCFINCSMEGAFLYKIIFNETNFMGVKWDGESKINSCHLLGLSFNAKDLADAFVGPGRFKSVDDSFAGNTLSLTIVQKLKQYAMCKFPGAKILFPDVITKPSMKEYFQNIDFRILEINLEDVVKALGGAEHINETEKNYFAHCWFTADQIKELYLLGVRNFRGVNLIGLDLSGQDLQGADFNQALFKDVNLTGANLTGGRITGKLLENVILQNACLENVDWNAHFVIEIIHFDIRNARINLKDFVEKYLMVIEDHVYIEDILITQAMADKLATLGYTNLSELGFVVK